MLSGLAACGGSGGSTGQIAPPAPPPPPPPPPPVIITTTVLGGSARVTGAIVFRDADGDGLQSTGEIEATTDTSGSADVQGTSGQWLAAGGFDTASGIDLDGITLAAPATATVVTPLTTLLARTAITEVQLTTALGIPTTVDLDTFDVTSATPSAARDAVMNAQDDVFFLMRLLQRLIEDQGIAATSREAQDIALDAIATRLQLSGADFNNFVEAQSLVLGAGLGNVLSADQVTLVAEIIELFYGEAPALTVLQFVSEEALSVYRTTRLVDAALATANGPDRLTLEFVEDVFDVDNFIVDVLLLIENSLPTAGVPAFAQPDFYGVDQGGRLLIRPGDADYVTSNDVLLDGGSVQVTSAALVTGFSEGSITVSSGGTIEINISDFFAGRTGFSYTAQTSAGDTFTGFAVLQVAPVTLVANAVDDTLSAAERDILTVLDVTANDANLDLNGLDIVAINGRPVDSMNSDVVLDSGAIVSTFTNDSLTFAPGGVYNGLSGGETATEIFTYSFLDQNGGIQSATVTLTIEGQDNPPISGETLSITEDSEADSMSTQIALEDGTSFTIGPIQEPALTSPLEELSRFGTFLITPEGSVTYTLDQVKVDRFGLSEGQTVTDQFLFSVYLEDGTRFDESIVVFIEGSNDLPTLEIIGSRPGGQIGVPGKAPFGSDIAYDAAGDIVYISTDDSQISRFNVSTLQFLSPIVVGDDIGQLELSPDGSHLFALERTVTMVTNDGRDAVTSFYDIDLETLSVTTVDLSSSRDGIQDIAAAAGDRLFLVNKTDVFTSELQIYDPNTGEITTISPFEANNLTPPPQTIRLDAASDGQVILLATPGFNDRYALYDTRSDSITAASDNETIAEAFGVFTNRLQGLGGLSAVNTDAGLIALTRGTNLFVLDLSLNPIFFVEELDVLTPPFDAGTLTTRVGEITDIQFSDDGSELFLYSRPQSEVFTFDISGRSITNRELTKDLGPFDSRFRQDRDSFIVSQEDDLLLVELAEGFLIESDQLNSEGGLGPRLITAADDSRSVSEIIFDDVDRLDEPFIDISGVDADAFVIEAAQNEFLADIIELRFVDTPDGAAPSDADQDGQFKITLEVNSGAGGIVSTDLVITLPDNAARQSQALDALAMQTFSLEQIPIEQDTEARSANVETLIGDAVPNITLEDLTLPIS